jgi:hypothetical protein
MLISEELDATGAAEELDATGAADELDATGAADELDELGAGGGVLLLQAERVRPSARASGSPASSLTRMMLVLLNRSLLFFLPEPGRFRRTDTPGTEVLP